MINLVAEPPSETLSKVASATLGIYLCHFIFIHIGYDVFLQMLPAGTPAAIRVLVNSMASFAVCYAFVCMLQRFKFTRRLVD